MPKAARPGPVQDHLGNKFTSEKQMCKSWNIPQYIYRRRVLDKKMSQKTALETPFDPNETREDPINKKIELLTKRHKINAREIILNWIDGINHDEIGVHVETEDALFVFLDDKRRAIEYFTAYSRKLAGAWPIKPGTWDYKNAAVKDHLGQGFRSAEEMAHYYEIPLNLFETRIREGWELEKALTTPSGEHIYDDARGHIFGSMHEIADYYHIPYRTLLRRLIIDGSVPSSVRIISPGTKLTEELTVLHAVEPFCENTNFVVCFKGQEEIWPYEKIIRYLHPEELAEKENK